MKLHINIFKLKSLLHINNIGSGLISFVAVQSSSHSSAEIAKHLMAIMFCRRG